MAKGMKFISTILFVVLMVIAALHAYWGVGGLWPAASERELIDTVIGSPGFVRMPPAWMTFIVVALLLIAGALALSASGVLPLGWEWLARIGAGGVALVFLARGVSGYWLPMRPGIELTEPFATLDVTLYSPLCLALGLGFAVIAAAGRR
jgi:hypothetical protein